MKTFLVEYMNDSNDSELMLRVERGDPLDMFNKVINLFNAYCESHGIREAWIEHIYEMRGTEVGNNEG